MSTTPSGRGDNGAGRPSRPTPEAVTDEAPHLPADRPARSTVLLSKILDDLIPIPGTKQSIGADAIAAFVPGVGNAAGTAMSGVVIADAIRLRVPLPILGRMLFNVGIDAAVGYVPFVGPFLDAAWRANRRNMRLLERTLIDERKTAQSSVTYLIVAVTLSVTVLVALLASAVFALWTVVRFLNWVAY